MGGDEMDMLRLQAVSTLAMYRDVLSHGTHELPWDAVAGILHGRERARASSLLRRVNTTTIGEMLELKRSRKARCEVGFTAS